MVKRSFWFACLTGLRISDLRALTWKGVQGAELRITQKKTGDDVLVPISDQARELLPERCNARPNEKVFDFPSRDDVYNRRLQWWVAKAGIEKHITSHIARHTFATLLVTQGNDLYAVQHLLGHRDIKVTQIYAKLVDVRKKLAINSLPNFNV
ncbi:MAG: integrase catalytic domain-containing protein [Ignavibacteria bacterium]|nr:integrase catalytic domain-containing protein [Ignavibacteria bacterium]